MIGEAAALTAAGLWALASLWYRRLGDVAGPNGLNLVKSLLALCLLVATLLVLIAAGLAEWRLDRLDAGQWTWLGVSGVVGLALGDSAYFAALVRLGASRTLMLWTLAPGFSALLGWWWLGEGLTTRMVLGIGATMAGVAWVVSDTRDDGAHGRSGALLSGVFWGVLAAACQGVAAVLSKVGGLGSGVEAPLSGLSISIVRLVFGLVALSAFALWSGEARRALALCRPPHRRILVVACFAGTYLGIWLSMFAVMRAATVGIAATLLSTSPIFALPLARLEGRRVGVRAVLGALVAVAGVALLCVR